MTYHRRFGLVDGVPVMQVSDLVAVEDTHPGAIEVPGLDGHWFVRVMSNPLVDLPAPTASTINEFGEILDFGSTPLVSPLAALHSGVVELTKDQYLTAKPLWDEADAALWNESNAGYEGHARIALSHDGVPGLETVKGDD